MDALPAFRRYSREAAVIALSGLIGGHRPRVRFGRIGPGLARQRLTPNRPGRHC